MNHAWTAVVRLQFHTNDHKLYHLPYGYGCNYHVGKINTYVATTNAKLYDLSCKKDNETMVITV